MRIYTIREGCARKYGLIEIHSIMSEFLLAHGDQLKKEGINVYFADKENLLEKMRDHWTKFLPSIIPEALEIGARIPFEQLIAYIRREWELERKTAKAKSHVWREYTVELISRGLEAQAADIKRTSKTADELDVRLDLLLTQEKLIAIPRRDSIRTSIDHDAQGFYSYALKHLDNTS